MCDDPEVRAQTSAPYSKLLVGHCILTIGFEDPSKRYMKPYKKLSVFLFARLLGTAPPLYKLDDGNFISWWCDPTLLLSCGLYITIVHPYFRRVVSFQKVQASNSITIHWNISVLLLLMSSNYFLFVMNEIFYLDYSQSPCHLKQLILYNNSPV